MPRQRIGGICRDGTYTTATGRGAGSHHGGIAQWVYSDSGSSSSSSNTASYGGGYYGLSSNVYRNLNIQNNQQNYNIFNIMEESSNTSTNEKLHQQIRKLKIQLEQSQKQIMRLKKKQEKQLLDVQQYKRKQQWINETNYKKSLEQNKKLTQDNLQLKEWKRTVEQNTKHYIDIINKQRDAIEKERSKNYQQNIDKLEKTLNQRQQAYNQVKQAYTKLKQTYNRKRQNFNKEKQQLANQKDTIIQALQVKLQAQRKSSDYKCQQLNQKINELKIQKDRQKQQLIAERHKQIHQLNFKSQFSSSQVSTLNNQILILKQKHEIEVKRIQDQHATELSKQRLRLNSLNDLKQNADKKVYQDKVASLIQEHNEAIKQLKDKMEKQHIYHINSLKQKLEESAKNYETQLQLKDSNYNKIVSNIPELKQVMTKSMQDPHSQVQKIKLNQYKRLNDLEVQQVNQYVDVIQDQIFPFLGRDESSRTQKNILQEKEDKNQLYKPFQLQFSGNSKKQMKSIKGKIEFQEEKTTLSQQNQQRVKDKQQQRKLGQKAIQQNSNNLFSDNKSFERAKQYKAKGQQKQCVSRKVDKPKSSLKKQNKNKPQKDGLLSSLFKIFLTFGLLYILSLIYRVMTFGKIQVQ